MQIVLWLYLYSIILGECEKDCWPCQPLCPSWLCHLLMCNCRQSEPRWPEWEPASAWPSRCCQPAWCLSWAPAPSKNHWALLSWWFLQTHDRGMNSYLVLVFFSPWKSRFYSDLFKNIWTLSWPCHCGMLIVPSLFQISDPSLLHIMSVSSRDLLGIRIACVCSRTSLGNHKWEGRTLCSSLSCALLLWGCLPWYLSCHQCYMFIEVFFKEINKLEL